jgi:SAM-dependent methyltransferase
MTSGLACACARLKNGRVADVIRSRGRRFSEVRMAENYRLRPPYPAEVYDTLIELMRGHPRIVLDAGCGTGKITLGLIDHLDRADAVDPSDAMLRVARSYPAAASSKIRWIHGSIEDAPLDPPYGLIVAASSIHWMDLDRTLPRFADALAEGAMLAVLDGDAPVDAPWEREETAFMIDFIAAQEGQRPNWWKTIRERFAEPVLMHLLFERLGHRITAPFSFSQSVADYLRCQHSRSAWSEDQLGAKASVEFDAEMTTILKRYARDGMLTFDVQTRMDWGRVRRS